MVANTLSDVLGFASIGCWLFAQFPQLLENSRRQSCEGLAMPFLANWFLGDVSNLIGCILTQQLPFQTYLATYFVFVDCTLLLQYIYYYQRPKQKTLPPVHTHIRSATSPFHSRRFSVDRYRTLSVVASNVANAAALVALQDESSGTPRTSPFLQRTGRQRHTTADREMEQGNEDREPSTDMIASFYSEGGRDSNSRRISWSIERHRDRASSVGHAIRRPPGLNLFPTETLISSQIPVSDAPPSHETQNFLESSESVSPAIAGAKGSLATRRGSTLIFLGVWALFGFGTLTLQGPSTYSDSSTKVGRVLSSIVYDVPSIPVGLGNTIHHARSNSLDVPELNFINQPTSDGPLHDESDAGEQPLERVIGRIFAWTCATLYFTARLPQIWKNYARKSVEGLSMYLFIFAFFGNAFYVASILCSPRLLLPPHEASIFMRETIPYVIGSGGTLMFDITIVSQSFCYRRRHRRHSTHPRADEAEGALLSDDALGTHPPTEASSLLNRGRTSHVLTSI